MLDLSQFDDPVDFQEAISVAFQDATFATAAVAKLNLIAINLERQREAIEYDLMLVEHPQAIPFFAQCQAAENAGFRAMMES